MSQEKVWPDFDFGCDPQDNDKVEVTYIMRALDPEVFDAVWTFEQLKNEALVEFDQTPRSIRSGLDV